MATQVIFICTVILCERLEIVDALHEILSSKGFFFCQELNPLFHIVGNWALVNSAIAPTLLSLEHNYLSAEVFGNLNYHFLHFSFPHNFSSYQIDFTGRYCLGRKFAES